MKEGINDLMKEMKMNEWIKGWMNEWTNEKKNACINNWIHLKQSFS